VGLTAARLTGIVTARLNRQVLDGVIKAFKDVVLEDLGDTVRVNYTVAAVEPLNFIRITASVARF
jgi:ribosomal protein S5